MSCVRRVTHTQDCRLSALHPLHLPLWLTRLSHPRSAFAQTFCAYSSRTLGWGSECSWVRAPPTSTASPDPGAGTERARPSSLNGAGWNSRSGPEQCRRQGPGPGGPCPCGCCPRRPSWWWCCVVCPVGLWNKTPSAQDRDILKVYKSVIFVRGESTAFMVYFTNICINKSSLCETSLPFFLSFIYYFYLIVRRCFMSIK